MEVRTMGHPLLALYNTALALIFSGLWGGFSLLRRCTVIPNPSLETSELIFKVLASLFSLMAVFLLVAGQGGVE